MNNRYYAHYVGLDDFKKVVQTKKPLQFNTEPFLMIEPCETYNSNSFRCKMIEHEFNSTGIGYTGWNYVTKKNINTRWFYQKYLNGEDIFFTTDGVSFYKPVNLRFDTEGIMELLLSLITLPNFLVANTAFMIMPFKSKELNEFYKTHICSFLNEKMKIKVARADDFNDADVIIDTIYREIEKSEFILCEITECNKNVFFEIGYAKALNKSIILMAQKGVKTDFFDLDHVRRIEYDSVNPDQFQNRLIDTMETIRGKR